MSPPTPAGLLEAVKTDAFLVTNPINIRYLTGCKVSSGALLVRPKSATLFVSDLYAEKAASQAFAHVHIQNADTMRPVLSKLRRVAIEGDYLTVALQSSLERKYKNTKFIHKDWIVEEFRRKKSADEIRFITRACIYTKTILKAVPRLLRKGFTEKGLAFELELLARKIGADGMAFETIVAYGEHTSRPHHSVTDKRYSAGQLVLVDMGTQVNGYASDFTRMYFSKLTVEQAIAYRALTEAKKKAERALKPGITNHALDTVAREYLKKQGYEKEFCHSLGHGLGLEIHEGVNLSGKAPKKKLLKHEVITIEPGLYFPGKWGMRLEDTHVIS